jgi:hypothetical protein
MENLELMVEVDDRIRRAVGVIPDDTADLGLDPKDNEPISLDE